MMESLFRRELGMRAFYLVRTEDVSGVSGTGIVAYGVVLPSGRAVMEWNSRWQTLTIFTSLDQVQKIHGHQGRTQVRLGDPGNLATYKRFSFLRWVFPRRRRRPPVPSVGPECAGEPLRQKGTFPVRDLAQCATLGMRRPMRHNQSRSRASAKPESDVAMGSRPAQVSFASATTAIAGESMNPSPRPTFPYEDFMHHRTGTPR